MFLGLGCRGSGFLGLGVGVQCFWDLGCRGSVFLGLGLGVQGFWV